MNKKEIIEKTKDYAKNSMAGAESGHDWWHIYRVWKMAKYIGKREKSDMFVVELAALLHDIGDWKFHGKEEGPRIARKWLESLGVGEEIISHVTEIIDCISFRGESEKETMRSLEGKVVQDADRLDAIGALGIARVFTYTGYTKRPIHDPKRKIKKNMNISEYKNYRSTAINHFYEKLLLLRDRMNTKTGKSMAQVRHKFMKLYLGQFHKEWKGEI